jgi:uncharacterized protein (TIGR02996 family)
VARKQPQPPADPWDVQAIEAKAPDEKSVRAARKVLKKGGFGKVEPRADGQGWWVKCKGLTGTYEVSVRRGPRGGVESSCTCPNPKRPCKHALAFVLYLAENPKKRLEAETIAKPAPAAQHATDFEPLLRAAFAEPEDDTARLVLADYLEENDQPDRAALIRVQCELARLPKKDAGRKALAAREKQLLAAIRKQIGTVPGGYAGSFVRGFLQLRSVDWRIKKVDNLPARLVQLFRDGWVESLSQPVVAKGMVPLYRLVGELDLSAYKLAASTIEMLVEELRPGAPDTRTRVVRLHSANEKQYRKLTAGSGVT